MIGFATATLLALVNQVSGTPYVSGGDSPRGTDCSGLASWVANAATGRPIYGDRFHTANEEAALLARGFRYGTAPGALVIGWNGRHTAVTLPDGTPVSSGEGGGVRVGGGGAYQSQFTHHMFLPVEVLEGEAAPSDAPLPPFDPFAPPPPPEVVDAGFVPPPAPDEVVDAGFTPPPSPPEVVDVGFAPPPAPEPGAALPPAGPGPESVPELDPELAPPPAFV